MVNTSLRPITVDGIRLDTLAWNITKVNRAVAGRRDSNQVVPGRDGVIASLNDDLEAPTFGLEMFVQGTDADGAVPAAGRQATFRDNLDTLVHLFGTRHRLIEVVRQMGTETDATNLALNPSWEGPTTYTTSAAQMTTAIQTVGDAVDGTKVLRSTTNAAPPGVVTLFLIQTAANRAPAAPGQAIGVRFKIRSVGGVNKSCRVRIRPYAGTVAQSDIGVTPFTTTGAWQEVSLSDVLPAGCDGFSVLVQGLTAAEWAVGDYVELDTLTLWAGTDPVTWFDGGTPADQSYTYVWSGTADNSSSTRVARTRRRAWCKVIDSIQPDVNTPGTSAMFTVGLQIPAAVWEDYLSVDESWNTGYASRDVIALRGGTERITDAILTVLGPATNPTLRDPNTGAYVTLNRTLAAGEVWRVNCGTWSSRYGAGLTVASLDTDGTDGIAQTTWGGMVNQSALLTLTPVLETGIRRVRVGLTGTGFTSGTTTVTVRARRKWAL